jgi:hypothetical protein
MGRMRVTFWPVVGIAAFIALVLCGLGLAFVAEIFVTGAPHAIPRSPVLATVFSYLRSFPSGWASFSCDVRFVRSLPCGQPETGSKRQHKNCYTPVPSPHFCL